MVKQKLSADHQDKVLVAFLVRGARLENVPSV